MKFGNFSVISLGLILSAAMPSQAARVWFEPSGTLDNIPLLEFPTRIGNPITFTTYLDTTGLPAPLKTFTYQIAHDTTEITFADLFTRSQEDQNLFPILNVDFIDPGNVIMPANISRTAIDVGIPTDLSQIQLETVFYTVGPQLIDDGQSDRWLILQSAFDINGNDITNFFIDNNVRSSNIALIPAPVPEPSSVISLFGLGTLGTALLFKQKLSKKEIT